MFGYVMANLPELTGQERARYQSIYCGICRCIRQRSCQIARLGLQYDMAFLALLLMSLYEPEETSGERGCALHPVKSRGWNDNPYVRYAADMNIALAYYKALDDCRDEGRPFARYFAGRLEKDWPELATRYPRQCGAIAEGIARLSRLEQENCPDPDAAAGCFGELMGQLLVYRQDAWETPLYQLGMALGRYIYLADAAVDYRRDRKKGSYNPYLAMGMGEDWAQWDRYLVLAMGRCTDYYERLPLVQDKKLLDNILYSGVWVQYRRKCKEGGK